MCLVDRVGIVTLSREAKVDTLTTPFTKGKMVAPGTYPDTGVQNLDIKILFQIFSFSIEISQ